LPTGKRQGSEKSCLQDFAKIEIKKRKRKGKKMDTGKKYKRVLINLLSSGKNRNKFYDFVKILIKKKYSLGFFMMGYFHQYYYKDLKLMEEYYEIAHELGDNDAMLMNGLYYFDPDNAFEY
jgi:ADP-glucose pyrophosphorylase